jgi:hypothetical protein
LLALKSGGRAVLADTDRDRILVVDVEHAVLAFSFDLGSGAEPGRLVEDAAGRVHVLLRGTGELVSLDAATGSVLARRAICPAPRGVAYEAASDRLLVACLAGSLLELPAAGGAALRTTFVDSDLRDVAFLGGALVVTRFRSAELLFLDDNRQIQKRVQLPGDGAGFEPSVAWRAITTPDGSLLIAHQRSFGGIIELGAGDSSTSSGPVVPRVDVSAGFSTAGSAGAAGAAGAGAAAGGAGHAGDQAGGTGGSGPVLTLPSHGGYASGIERCGSVVQGTTTFVRADGSEVPGPNLDGAVLPVDVATNGSVVAIAFAGAPTNQAAVDVYSQDRLTLNRVTDCIGPDRVGPGGGVVAVAFDPQSGKLLIQRRQPAELHIVDTAAAADTPDTVVGLGGDNVFDTGHALFHTDTGGGIACASCHPEGTEDGRVWNFSDVGTRRTQPLDVGLAGTAPFHWDNDLADFGVLMDRIFAERMGGPSESVDRKQALEQYVYSLPRRPALRDASDAAAVRGKSLFEAPTTGCATCHAGPHFSNNGLAEIGKGPALEVPSLVAVSARAPYMHDGCAASLLDRFDPNCGGSAHGDVSALTSAELADLVAYLETL